MNFNEVIIKYYRLVVFIRHVFIRHDSAEIWGFRYALARGIGTLKIMASTCVFVRVVCALTRSISCDPQAQCIILT
jgi:hypothetical protein